MDLRYAAATLLLTSALIQATPAQANCSGSFSGSSYSGTCRDSSGGSYRMSGYGDGPARVNGYTGNGTNVNGTVNSNGTFNGYVGDKYVSCNRYGCY